MIKRKMNIHIGNQQLRKFGLLVSILICMIFFIFPFFLDKHFNYSGLIFSLILIYLSLFSPILLLKPYQIWMKIGKFLGVLNSQLILVIFFYFIITPVALILRCFKALNNTIDKKTTYYKKNSSFHYSTFNDQY